MKTDSINISKRLLLVASFTKGSNVLCDIGCDHAYLPVYAVINGYANTAIAMDIGEGPLENARENIEKYGLEEKIKTRLSNGLDCLKPGEADCIVITGMGGILIKEILEQHPEVWKSANTLVLSPHRDESLVREYLSDKCLFCQDEYIRDRKSFYTVMKYLPKGCPNPVDKKEILFGKNPSEEYLHYKKQNIEKILSTMEKNARASDIIEKRTELEAELKIIEELYDSK